MISTHILDCKTRHKNDAASKNKRFGFQSIDRNGKDDKHIQDMWD